jgi:hypothetical protein
MSINALAPLLHPPERQLPSLRKLGLRAVDASLDLDEQTEDGGTRAKLQRARWMKVIMWRRSRYIDVVWE